MESSQQNDQNHPHEQITVLAAQLQRVMAPQSSIAALGYAVLGMAQLSNALLVTITSHVACSTTTTATLPACGWISTSGTSRPYCFSTSSSRQPSPSTSITGSVSAPVLPPSYSVPSDSGSSTNTAPIVSVTVTPLPSTSSIPPVSLPSPISSTSVPPISLPSPISSSSVPPISLPLPISESIPVVSVTVTPLPTTSSSAILPPVYTDPIIATSTEVVTATASSSSTPTTLTTISAPLEYEGSSTSVDCGLLGLNCPVSTNSPSISTITTLTTVGAPPVYEEPSTTTSTGAAPTDAADLGYCYQDGALLDVNVNITITDNLGSVYVLLCTSTSLGVSLTGTDLLTVPAPNSVDDCFVACDEEELCTGFTFQSIAPWGVGPGTCFLYQGLGLAFEATAEANLIAFIRLDLLAKRTIGKRRAVLEIGSEKKSLGHGAL